MIMKSFNNRYKAFFVGILMTGITGCTPHRETFDCAPGVGVGCKSISEVNHLIDNKEQEEALSKGQGLQLQSTQSLSTVSPGLRVWIAPYEDSNGYVHEESFVVLKPKPVDLEGETK